MSPPVKSIDFTKIKGDFTWGFSDRFFIETEKHGNFIWSDPDYYGTGEINPTDLSYEDWIEKEGIPFGRAKGRHIIASYCELEKVS